MAIYFERKIFLMTKNPNKFQRAGLDRYIILL